MNLDKLAVAYQWVQNRALLLFLYQCESYLQGLIEQDMLNNFLDFILQILYIFSQS